MESYQKSKEQVIKELGTDITFGLENSEVKKRAKKYGANRLPDEPRDSWFHVFFRQFKSPLIYILLLAAVIIFFVGHDKLDAFIISGVLFFNALVGAIQEGRARNILDSLKRYIKSESVVIRSGKKLFVDDTGLVPGDIIFLLEGERVPADVRVVESTNLKIDEAVLTGESTPVKKTSNRLEKKLAVHDQSNMAFKGTYVLSGSGKAVVVSTGLHTQIGKISKVAESIEEDMPLKRELNNLSRWIVFFILAMCVIIFVIGFATGRPARELLVILTALFICVIPEGLPVVLTLVLVKGAYKLAKKYVLVKRMQAVEGLGQADTILIDKTGTLTRNELVVSKVVVDEKTYKLSGLGYFTEGEVLLNGKKIDPYENDKLILIGKAGRLLNRAEINYMKDKNLFEIKGDPTEASMFVMSRKIGIDKDYLEDKCEKVYEVPFSSKWRYHAVFCKMEDGKGLAFISGAPEEILSRSKDVSQEDKNRLHDMLSEGLRVVAVAIKVFDPASLPPETASEREKRTFFEAIVHNGLRYLGLCGIQDSIRSEVSALVKDTRNAGINIVMVTGDHKETALFVAKKVGIYQPGDSVLDGKQLETLSDKELNQKLDKIKVFARVAPEQKLRIVEAFKKKGQIVAMTGDGINDAPSLMAANLGIAMGGIGTEVAKQASDIVLLDDSFANIVRAIEYGRYVFYTLRRVILYFFATNMGEILVILFAVVLSLPLPITAAQILWLNLITDGFLDTALAAEKEEKDVVARSPSESGFRLIDTSLLAKMMYMALPMGIVSTWVFYVYYPYDIVHARSMTLVTMAMFQWFNAFNCRSETKSVFQLGLFSNKWLLLAIAAVLGLQFFVLHNPVMQRIFDTKPISGSEWVLIFVLSSSIFFIEEIRKFIVRRWRN
ncbi:cation-translocating P-type ATPase [Candidatus Dependentiae bacterium]